MNSKFLLLVNGRYVQLVIAELIYVMMELKLAKIEVNVEEEKYIFTNTILLALFHILAGENTKPACVLCDT